MVVVNQIGGHKIVSARGKIGLPNGLGFATCGVTKLGDDFESAGIYRRNGRHRNSKLVRMRHYVPTNPQTVVQQQRRSTFASGVEQWHLLTEIQKQDFRDRAKPLRISGFNLHQREFLANN